MIHRPRSPRPMAVMLLTLIMLAGCGAAGTTPPAVQPTTVARSTTAPAPIPRTEDPQDIILATTTSTQDSGLLDVLIPMFEQQTGYQVKTVAIGSGAAIALGQRGEADVVLAHAPENEKDLVASGAGINRQLVMYNDFILVGPATDPAGIRGQTDALAALRTIAAANATFVSRGDKSGTHQLEQKLWKAVGVAPTGQAWYVESGSGMGQTLQIADQRSGYTLTDRATYLAFTARVALAVMVEGDPQLLNIYHVIAVNPERFAQVNAAGGAALIQFLLHPDTQQAIATFGEAEYGQALFTACAQNSCQLKDTGD